MTESAYYIQRKGQNPRRESASSHLVNALIGNQGNKIVPQHLVPTSPSNRNQRRINVDRVSISGLLRYKSRAKRLPIALVANNIAPVTMRETARLLSARQSFNADSYSRCFRYLDCFNGGLVFGRFDYWPHLVGIGGLRFDSFKAVYLSSQLDRILGLNKAMWVSSGTSFFTPCPVGVCRIDWAAQLTQTKQGGCLYEWPGVRYGL